MANKKQDITMEDERELFEKLLSNAESTADPDRLLNIYPSIRIEEIEVNFDRMMFSS